MTPLTARWVLAAALACSCWSVGYARDRHWLTGTWTDVGLRRDPFVVGGTGGSGRSVPMPASPARTSSIPEVGRYVIDTADFRLELQDLVPIGSSAAFDASVKVGDAVTFAIEKSSVYILDVDGSERRLRLVKKTAKKKQQ